MSYHYAGLAMLVTPPVYLVYRAWKAGQLKPVLQGAGLVLLTAAWSVGAAYLLSH